jgi:hypothetical protein
MVVTNQGRPIEVQFRPGGVSDISVLWTMKLDIPSDSLLYADGGYNCFDLEDILQEERIWLNAKRGSKAKNRIRGLEEERQISSKRQIVETAFSSIINQFPRYIRCRAENGFLIKIFCFILSYSASLFGRARSHKTIYKAPSTALRISARRNPCLRRVLLYLGPCKSSYARFGVAIRV